MSTAGAFHLSSSMTTIFAHPVFQKQTIYSNTDTQILHIWHFILYIFMYVKILMDTFGYLEI